MRPNGGKAQDKHSIGSASCQSTISHYNINGNFLQGLSLQRKGKSSSQFILHSPNRPGRQREEEGVGVATLG
jgi:hypothetical protein